MLVFRRVNVSDMRYYINQLLSKSAEGKAARSPKREVHSAPSSSQNVSAAEGVRKERKRKLDTVVVDDDRSQRVSCLKQFVLRHTQGLDFKASDN